MHRRTEKSPIIAQKVSRVQGPVSVVLGTVTVMFLWAICFPLITTGLEFSSPFYFAGMRALIAGVSLLIPCWLLGRPAPVGIEVWFMLFVVGLTVTSMGFFGMFLASEFIAPGLATVLANTQPLIAALLAYVVLNERLYSRSVIGIVFGFVGVIVIGLGASNNDDGTMTVGIIYILIGALGVAMGNVAMKRLAGKVDVPTAMGWQLLIGSVPLLVLAGFMEGGQTVTWSVSFILSLVTVSLLGTSVAFVLWFWLLQYNELNRLNVFSFLTPAFGLLMGVAFFGESIGLPESIGIGLIIIGILLANVRLGRK